MTNTLLAVGVIVFFVSVYGVVMVGSHLLRQDEDEDEFRSNRPPPDTRDGGAATITPTT